MKNKVKKFILGDDHPPIHYRPGTSDEAIIKSLILEAKEYKFPHCNDVKLIYDIGSHIGVAAIVLHDVYPEAVIHCFEPEPENFELLRMNTEHLGAKVILNKVALSNYNGTTELFNSADPNNLGGFSTHIKPEEEDRPGQQVPVVRTSFYMAKVGIPQLIKTDCEGAEHDIFLDIPDLSEVLWITGELHGVKEFELLAHLQNRGFEIEALRPLGAKVWNFQAANKLNFFAKDAPQP